MRTVRGNRFSSNLWPYSCGSSFLQEETAKQRHARDSGGGAGQKTAAGTADRQTNARVAILDNVVDGEADAGKGRVGAEVSPGRCGPPEERGPRQTHHRRVCSRSGELTVLSTKSVDVELNLLELAKDRALSSSSCAARSGAGA